MASNRNHDPETRPAPAGPKWLIYVLVAICATLVVVDFIYEKHGYLAIEDAPLFYALLGFFASLVLMVVARVLRLIVGRREDYYAPRDVIAEPYPKAQLDKVDDNA